VPIAIRGLALDSVGRSSPALNFYGILLVAPDYFSPSACRFTRLVWSTMAFDPTTGKTQRTCQMPFPPFDPSWHLAWAINECCRTRNASPDASDDETGVQLGSNDPLMVTSLQII
jgi:hypothetical protein